MPRKTYHVVKQDGEWKVEGEHARRAAGVFDTKVQAVERAIDLAKAQPLGQVIIHRGDGVIQEERTYGEDPYPPRG